MVPHLPDSFSPTNSDSKDPWINCSHLGPLSAPLHKVVFSLISHKQGGGWGGEGIFSGLLVATELCL